MLSVLGDNFKARNHKPPWSIYTVLLFDSLVQQASHEDEVFVAESVHIVQCQLILVEKVPKPHCYWKNSSSLHIIKSVCLAHFLVRKEVQDCSPMDQIGRNNSNYTFLCVTEWLITTCRRVAHIGKFSVTKPPGS